MSHDQAYEVPFVEQLRSVPKDCRLTIAIQWAEDGAETGHQFIPVGFMMHRAADEIERLQHDVSKGMANHNADLNAVTEVAAPADINDREAIRYSLADLDWFCQLAASAAIQAALLAIDDEPELPGQMPDAMWEAIRNDRDAVEQAMRIGVRQTKSGIKERLLRDDAANGGEKNGSV